MTTGGRIRGRCTSPLSSPCPGNRRRASSQATATASGRLALAPAYEGSKDYYRIDDPEDAAFLAELTDVTVNALPEPKPKKPKGVKGVR